MGLRLIFYSAFEDPIAEYQLVADSVRNLIAEVQRSLKLGVNLGCSFSGGFPIDVFSFVFNSLPTNDTYVS